MKIPEIVEALKVYEKVAEINLTKVETNKEGIYLQNRVKQLEEEVKILQKKARPNKGNRASMFGMDDDILANIDGELPVLDANKILQVKSNSERFQSSSSSRRSTPNFDELISRSGSSGSSRKGSLPVARSPRLPSPLDATISDATRELSLLKQENQNLLEQFYLSEKKYLNQQGKLLNKMEVFKNLTPSQHIRDSTIVHTLFESNTLPTTSISAGLFDQSDIDLGIQQIQKLKHHKKLLTTTISDIDHLMDEYEADKIQISQDVLLLNQELEELRDKKRKLIKKVAENEQRRFSLQKRCEFTRVEIDQSKRDSLNQPQSTQSFASPPASEESPSPPVPIIAANDDSGIKELERRLHFLEKLVLSTMAEKQTYKKQVATIETKLREKNIIL